MNICLQYHVANIPFFRYISDTRCQVLSQRQRLFDSSKKALLGLYALKKTKINAFFRLHFMQKFLNTFLTT